MSIADELIKRGWCQRTLSDSEGRVCLFGAACAAYGIEINAACDVMEVLPGDVLQALWEAAHDWPSDFNDVEGRTFDEVLRVAKEADETLSAAQ